jgi:hypothetical protein
LRGVGDEEIVIDKFAVMMNVQVSSPGRLAQFGGAEKVSPCSAVTPRVLSVIVTITPSRIRYEQELLAAQPT